MCRPICPFFTPLAPICRLISSFSPLPLLPSLDALQLRRILHIVCEPVGTLVNQSVQNTFLGPPYIIAPEAVRVLLDRGETEKGVVV